MLSYYQKYCAAITFFAMTANYAAFGVSEHFLLHTEPTTLLWMCLQNCVLCELQLCAMCMLRWPESLCTQVRLTVYFLFIFFIPALQSKEPHHLKTIFILKSHVTLDAYMDNHKHQKWFIFFPSWAPSSNTRQSQSTRPPSQRTTFPAQQGEEKKDTEDNVTRPKLCSTTDCRWIGLPSPPWHFALVLFSSMCLTDELNKKTLKTHKKERENLCWQCWLWRWLLSYAL